MNKKQRYKAIYARKSKLTHSGESIEIQIQKCKSYIDAHHSQDAMPEIRIYKDEGYSGGNINRPQFKELLNDCLANKVSHLICYRLDRVSRNLSDFAQLYNQLKAHDIEFISVNEDFDTSSLVGETMLKIFMVFAELERKTIAERVRDNMLGLAKTGRWLGGTTPLGYKSKQLKSVFSIDDKVRYLYQLETITDEKAIYIRLLNKYLETGTLTSVQTYSHQAELRTRTNKFYSTTALKAIFRNPVYAAADQDTYNYFSMKHSIISMDLSSFDGKHGLMVYNKTDQSDGKSHAMHPMEEWIIAVGRHEAFISGKEWVKLQILLDKSQTRAFRQPRNNTALLSGLLRCGKCHSFMRPKNYNRTDKNGHKVYSYLCEEKEKSKGHNCDMKNPRGNELDELVCNEIKKLSKDETVFSKQLDNIEQLILKDSVNSQSEISLLSASIAEKDKRIKNLVQSLSESGDTASSRYISDEINSLDSSKIDIQKRIDELKLIEKDKEKILSDIDVLKNNLVNFSNAFDMMPYDEKKRTLRTLIKAVTWDGNTVHIYLMGSEEDSGVSEDIDIEDYLEPMQGGGKRNFNVPACQEKDKQGDFTV